MKDKSHIISKVEEGSIAWELELSPGDELISMNDHLIEDVFDYRYMMNDEFLTLLVRKPNGEEWELEVEKDYDEDLGIEFENGLMDDYRSCSNKCIFCFIDQMPPGMRETLYFKDDDSRLSFLQGNYVTLTNMSDHDIDRIIKFHLAPINISFQTMNPRLRCKMLHNRFAGDVLSKVDTLYEAGIEMNGQIVLCKGINDGAELDYSLDQLTKYAPVLQSVSIVPVGLTRFRDGLYPLEPFNKEDSLRLIASVERVQARMMDKYGIHFVHASDEWYIQAGLELPEEDRYDGYLQLENGVGMLRLLGDEIKAALEEKSDCQISDKRRVLIATGVLPAPYIEKYALWVMDAFPGVEARVIPIINNFFGPMITVSGLITGQDLIEQIRQTLDCDAGAHAAGDDAAGSEKTGKLGAHYDALLIPVNMLRSGEEVFLDDITVRQVSETLNIPVVVVDSSGADFVSALIDPASSTSHKRRQIYEQSSSSDCRKA